MDVDSNRRWLLPIGLLIFLSYAAWNARTPGQPRTVKDFLFILEIFAIPFVVLIYAITAFPNWKDISVAGAGMGLRHRVAIVGSALGIASAALLLLLLPFWSVAIEHQVLAEYWVIAGILLATGAAFCGIFGAPKLRRPAVVTVVLIPFWSVLAIFLLKAVLD